MLSVVLVVDWLTGGGFSSCNHLVTPQRADLSLSLGWRLVVMVPVHCLMGRHLASWFPEELLLYISPGDICPITLVQ